MNGNSIVTSIIIFNFNIYTKINRERDMRSRESARSSSNGYFSGVGRHNNLIKKIKDKQEIERKRGDFL
jgi:hypothetical protein